MAETIPDTKLGQAGVGYWVGAYLSQEGIQAVDELRNTLRANLPADLLWSTPSDALHTTLFEVAMLYREYDTDKDEWFTGHADHIISVLGRILMQVAPIDVRFSQIEVSPSAIIIKGTDDGTFDSIRKQVEEAGIIMPGSRTPPDIIHSSIFRYQREFDLDTVHNAAEGLSLDFTMTVSEFCLQRVGIVPMGDVSQIASFKLG